MRKYLFGSVTALALVVAAACSSGTSSGPAVPYPAASALGSAPLSSKSSTTIALAPSTGLGSGSIGLLGSGTVSVTQSTTNPTGTVAVSVKTLAQAKKAASASANTPVAYVTLTASGAVTLTSISSLSVAPSPLQNGTYNEAFWNGQQWVTIGAAGTVKNGLITFAATQLNPPVSLNSGDSLYLVIYTGSIFTTPTPPPAAPVGSPNPLDVSTGTNATLTVTSGVGIALTAVSKDTTIATVQNATANTGAGSTATFTIHGVHAGTTTVTVTDPLNHSTNVTVNVSDLPPSPNPNIASAVFQSGSTTTLQISTRPGVIINAQSANSAVLSVSPNTVTADSNGNASFTVTAGTPGSATITFTDSYNDTGSFTGNVSSITNGAFTVSGSASINGWTPCSYNYTWPGPVNASPVPMGTPAATPTPIPFPAITSGLSQLARTATPPPNLEPGNGITVTNQQGPIPSAVGTNVAYLGDAGSETKGVAGICQTFTPIAAEKYLYFWVYEAGSEYNLGNATQEADILNQAGSSVTAPLFVEQNCFWDPGVVGQTGYTNSGCIPPSMGSTSPYLDFQGGYWVQRSFDLSQFVTLGQPVTLFFGVWDKSTHGSPSAPVTYGNALFIGNVQTTGTATPPTSLPMTGRHTMSLALHHR